MTDIGSTTMGDASATDETAGDVQLKDFELLQLDGPYPVKAHGMIEGHHWFFRAQGRTWMIEIGGTPTFTQPPIWWHEEVWEQGDAGAMPLEQAATCINKALRDFLSKKLVQLKPGDDGYDDHLLLAWSEGLISAATVGDHFSLNVIEVVRLGLKKGLPQPWTATLEVQRYLNSLSNTN